MSLTLQNYVQKTKGLHDEAQVTLKDDKLSTRRTTAFSRQIKNETGNTDVNKATANDFLRAIEARYGSHIKEIVKGMDFISSAVTGGTPLSARMIRQAADAAKYSESDIATRNWDRLKTFKQDSGPNGMGALIRDMAGKMGISGFAASQAAVQDIISQVEIDLPAAHGLNEAEIKLLTESKIHSLLMPLQETAVRTRTLNKTLIDEFIKGPFMLDEFKDAINTKKMTWLDGQDQQEILNRLKKMDMQPPCTHALNDQEAKNIVRNKIFEQLENVSLTKARGQDISRGLTISAPNFGGGKFHSITPVKSDDLPKPQQITAHNNSSFLACVVRGMTETLQGKKHLLSIVRKDDKTGDYVIRLKTDEKDGKAQFKDVRIPPDALANYRMGSGRARNTNEFLLALECAVLNLHQKESRDKKYVYGNAGQASHVADFLNLSPKMLNYGRDADSLKTVLNKALKDGNFLVFRDVASGKYTTVTGLQGDEVRGDSLENGESVSISLKDFRQGMDQHKYVLSAYQSGEKVMRSSMLMEDLQYRLDQD